MSLTKVAVLIFDKGYHVGWREPRRIIDHTTLLRAFIYVAYLTGCIRCVELIEKGRLAASALLPTVKTASGCLKLLAPFPQIPCLGKAARLRGLFVSLSTLREILQVVSKCYNGGGAPIAFEVSVERKVVIRCTNVKDLKLELKRVKSIACLNKLDKDCSIIVDQIPLQFFMQISEHRNRVDRITGAADVYEVYGVQPQTPLWTLVMGSNEALDCAMNLLKILQKFGIGGLRSRGWGRFRIEIDTKICDDDEDILRLYSGWSTGFNYLLGSMPPGDWLDLEHSYAVKDVIMGRAGPSNNEYIVPIIYVMDVGAVVYTKDVPQPYIISLSGGRAIYIFNPVVIHAT